MTVLLLDEFEAVSKEELGPTLKEEARKMFGPNSHPPLLRPQKQKRLALGFRYLARVTTSLSSLAYFSQKIRQI